MEGLWMDGDGFLLYCESFPRVSVTAGSVSVFIESRSNPGCGSPRRPLRRLVPILLSAALYEWASLRRPHCRSRNTF